MSERKVLNKYYPPDFDPSKIPRMKLPKNRQYTVRLMAPFNMRCETCGEYIYKGKKFNARKEDVENEDYLGIRIYRFYIKCTRCLQEISFKTDPKSTDYVIEAGATRNFMALKLAEEQALREEEEAKEEEANNPMKLLENRTKQSKNEIDLLESLEEIKDINRRQEDIDYNAMLSQYDSKLTEREKEEKMQQLDEEYIKTIKFGQEGRKRIVVEEEIIEVSPEKIAKTSVSGLMLSSHNPNSKIKFKKNLLLVKPKNLNQHSNISVEKLQNAMGNETAVTKDNKMSTMSKSSLLVEYSDSDESD
ncbi:splicing factor YJU2-like [Harmonia axyridis]|uniref:splicing factor YJU2-like n=1 Tax=Harmonia axyridis TaxID=115357 RepID=UPI001E279366|nr:splicing factor YJU2-like [Harmonia axyridis]XP_045465044.1 splicing factor YJU2-like [Harmonia axyridis]XP_045465045.1 splicing factor YJU2-like [Harmonia axyridis]